MTSLADAVKIYGVSERTIRRWMAEGQLPSTKKGRTTYVHGLTIERLAAASKRDRHKRAARPRFLAS